MTEGSLDLWEHRIAKLSESSLIGPTSPFFVLPGLLGAQAYKRCLLGVYSYRLATFIFIVMADSASISFLTRTEVRTPGKPVYRGGTGPPKNLVGYFL